MATNTRIKDALEPQLYEYYKNHRSKYQRYSQDLPTLRLRLFHDMVKDRAFKSERQKKFDPFVERKCSVWLSEITGETKNFDDFRKSFRNILKNYKYKSEKYYRACEEIVNENRFSLIQDDKFLSQNTEQGKSKRSLQNTEQVKNKSVLFNDTPNRHPINIDNDIVYRRMDNREIPFIRINGFSKMAPNNEVICEKCGNYMKAKFGEEFGFDDFCEYFDIELSSYKKWSDKWKLVCLKILAEQTSWGINENSTNYVENKITNKTLTNNSTDRVPINIDKDVCLIEVFGQDVLFLETNKESIRLINADELKKVCASCFSNLTGKERSFDDFCNYFSVELSLYNKWSPKWNLLCQKICKSFLLDDCTATESNIKDDFYWFAGILAWAAISYVLNPIVYLIFCYAVFIVESFLDIFTVSIGCLVDLPNNGFLLLHEYVTDDKLIFWIWLNCLTSIPALLCTIYDLIKNVGVYINIKRKQKSCMHPNK